MGKTALVLDLAAELGAEVVSVDSMQVYRRLDIGTAKPTPAERARVEHHLLDLVEPDEDYNASHFIADAERVCREIAGRGGLPLLSGGTGLYLKAFQEGLFEVGDCDLPAADRGENAAEVRRRLRQELETEGRAVLHARLRAIDPPAADRIHPHDTSRLLRGLEIYLVTGTPWSHHLARQQTGRKTGATRRQILKIGLTGERQWLYARIDRRAKAMLEGGLIAEVEALLAAGFSPELKPMQAIGYRHVIDFLAGRSDYGATLESLARDTRRYAKRQLTWFGRDPEILWFEPGQYTAIRNRIKSYLETAR